MAVRGRHSAAAECPLPAAASMAAFRAVAGDRLSLTIDQAATLAISTRGKDGQET